MTTNVQLDSTADVRDRFLESYRRLRNGCRPGVFDEAQFLTIVTELKNYIDAAILSGQAEESGFYDLRQGARRAVATLLRRAPWLSETTKRIASEFRDAQPEFFDERYKFTEDYSGNYASLWPEIFSPLAGRDDLTFVEVGSFEGMSACWFLTNILTSPSSRLICVDQFLQTDEIDGSTLFDTYVDSEGRSVFERFIYNVRLTGQSNQVRVLKESSDIALRSLPLHSVNAVYIDGSHEAKDVIQDAILAWGALKPGGLMVFDDYTWQPPFDTEPLHSPKPAVDAFLNLFAKQINVLHSGIQVAFRKLQ